MTQFRRMVLNGWAMVVAALTIASISGGASARDADLLGHVAADTRAECPAGSAMVGVAAKAGAAMVGLVAQCVRIGADLRWQEAAPSPGALLGSDDPALGIQSVTCVPDSFVTSIGANATISSADLSMIWIQCSNRAGPQQTAGQSILFPLDPGAASLGVGVSRCTAAEVPVGIAGHAGNAISGLSLVCAPASDFGGGVGQTTATGAGVSLLAGTGPGATNIAPAVRPSPALNSTELGPGAGAQQEGPGAGPGGPGGDSGIAVASLDGVGPGGSAATGPGGGLDATGPAGGLDSGSSASATGASANLPQDKLAQAANVRAAANVSGPVIDTLPAGTSVRYGERVGTWCHVFYDGKNGWISTTLFACGGTLTASKPAQKTKTKTTTTGSAPPPPPPPRPEPGTITLPGGITIHIGN